MRISGAENCSRVPGFSYGCVGLPRPRLPSLSAGRGRSVYERDRQPSRRAGRSHAKSVAVRAADSSVPPSALSRFRLVSVRRSDGEVHIARVRTGYCGVLRGYHGRAGRSAGAPLWVALRYGTAWRDGRYVRRQASGRARRRSPAARYAALSDAAGRREAPLRPVLRRATVPECGA